MKGDKKQMEQEKLYTQLLYKLTTNNGYNDLNETCEEIRANFIEGKLSTLQFDNLYRTYMAHYKNLNKIKGIM